MPGDNQGLWTPGQPPSPNIALVPSKNYPAPLFWALPFRQFGGIVGPPTVAGTAPSAVSSPLGAAYRFNGSSSLQYSAPYGGFTGDLTVVTVWRRNALGGGAQGVIGKRDGSNAEFGINFNVGSYYQWFYSVGGSYQILALSPSALPAIGIMATTVATRAKQRLAFAQNGLLLASGTQSAGPASAAAAPLCIAADVYTETAAIDVAFVCVLPIALSDGAAVALTLDPYSLLRPAVRPSFRASATAGLMGTASGQGSAAGTLTGAGALAGTASGQGSATGTVSGASALAGLAVGAGAAAGSLSGALALSGSSTGTGAALGNLGGASVLTGTASGSGTAVAVLAGALALGGASASTGTGTGLLRSTLALAGAAAGAGQANGNLSGSSPAMAATAAGTGFGFGILTGTLALSGSAIGASSAAGNLGTVATVAYTAAIPPAPPSGLRVEVNWTHPLAMGLVSCYVPSQGLHDLCGQGPILQPFGNAAIQAGANGVAHAGDITGSGLYAQITPPIQALAASGGTLFWAGTQRGAAVGSHISTVWGVEYSSALGSAEQSPYHSFVIGSAPANSGFGSNAAMLFVAGNSAATITIDASGVYGSKTVGVSFSALGSAAYLNGAPIGTAAAASIPIQATSSLEMGGYRYQPGRHPNALTNIALIYNRQLTAAEHAALARNPYAMLRPKFRAQFRSGVVIGTASGQGSGAGILSGTLAISGTSIATGAALAVILQGTSTGTGAAVGTVGSIGALHATAAAAGSAAGNLTQLLPLLGLAGGAGFSAGTLSGILTLSGFGNCQGGGVLNLPVPQPTPPISGIGVEAATMGAIGNFLLSVLPNGTQIVRGQDNLVPLPKGANWLTMTPIATTRLATNIDTWDTTPGDAPTASYIQTYQQVDVQVDCYGPVAHDMARVIMAVFRDDYAFSALDPFGVDPLYTSEPRNLTFVNDQSQYEYRWSIDLSMQINPSITVPTQFANQLAANGVISVDEAFPPGSLPSQAFPPIYMVYPYNDNFTPATAAAFQAALANPNIRGVNIESPLSENGAELLYFTGLTGLEFCGNFSVLNSSNNCELANVATFLINGHNLPTIWDASFAPAWQAAMSGMFALMINNGLAQRCSSITFIPVQPYQNGEMGYPTQQSQRGGGGGAGRNDAVLAAAGWTPDSYKNALVGCMEWLNDQPFMAGKAVVVRFFTDGDAPRINNQGQVVAKVNSYEYYSGVFAALQQAYTVGPVLYGDSTFTTTLDQFILYSEIPYDSLAIQVHNTNQTQASFNAAIAAMPPNAFRWEIQTQDTPWLTAALEAI